MLAMSPDSTVDPARRSQAHNTLSQYVKDGLIKLCDSGRTQTVFDPFAIGVLGKTDGTEFTRQDKVYVLSQAELQKIQHLLKAGGMWPKWADIWCGVPMAEIGTDPKESPNLPASSANSCLPFQTFKARAEGKFTRNLDSIYKHRSDTNRKQPYKEAFNEDGTVNEPVFIKIAESRGEWNDGMSVLSNAAASTLWRVK